MSASWDADPRLGCVLCRGGGPANSAGFALEVMSWSWKRTPIRVPVAVADGYRSFSRRMKRFLNGAATIMPSPQVAIDQRSNSTRPNLVGPFSAGVARNSKAGMKEVRPAVNGDNPSAPAMISIVVVSIGVSGLEI